MTEFVAWPKTPRWNREVVITEKIDGTNAAIIIEPWSNREHYRDDNVIEVAGCDIDNGTSGNERSSGFAVLAQSRKRLITAGSDNFGFAAWVQENADSLVRDLGPGRHFGEWYGKGVQRGYGLDHRRFALFNTSKWADAKFETEHLEVVPVLNDLDRPSDEAILATLEGLRDWGSSAVDGYMNPEGIVIFHTAANQVFKILIENDDKPKGLAA